jgi:IS5 family transposase
LVTCQPGCFEHPGKKGGGADQEVGRNPTDRGKAGSKRHFLVDRQGIPLAVWLTAANVHDSVVFEDLIEAVEPIKRPHGRPRQRPAKLHADKGYDFPRCRDYLRKRGIGCRIARRGIESSQTLGRYRWVVERTFAWLNRFRRLTIRYERLADIHLAFLDLACALICFRFLPLRF